MKHSSLLRWNIMTIFELLRKNFVLRKRLKRLGDLERLNPPILSLMSATSKHRTNSIKYNKLIWGGVLRPEILSPANTINKESFHEAFIEIFEQNTFEEYWNNEGGLLKWPKKR